MVEALARNVITLFVQGVISSNLTNLNNLASKEAGLLLGVWREITNIIEELEIKSAEEKQETDSMARVWLRRFREVSFDMENCMEKFEIYLKRRHIFHFIMFAANFSN
ncbi:hypothetical protein MA16_Dca002206 [Dendrobium catenatum]|uniref:Disease resistance N-terminal domain-containing protein n=1 Tax=Dendrobium catenatum TaxID=906689 RepID=A0A2I0VZW3_9ASPA|nr:hypothetical protein MA16_Dca002206 [Dendrobium catenatum]